MRYVANGREVIGTGYSTGSRLQIGRGSSTVREYEQFKIGAQVPCWFDPDDPTRVMVLPGFGGAYVLLLPGPADSGACGRCSRAARSACQIWRSHQR